MWKEASWMQLINTILILQNWLWFPYKFDNTETGSDQLLCKGKCKNVIFLPVCIVFSLMHFSKILLLSVLFVSMLLLLLLLVVCVASQWVAYWLFPLYCCVFRLHKFPLITHTRTHNVHTHTLCPWEPWWGPQVAPQTTALISSSTGPRDCQRGNIEHRSKPQKNTHRHRVMVTHTHARLWLRRDPAAYGPCKCFCSVWNHKTMSSVSLAGKLSPFCLEERE